MKMVMILYHTVASEGCVIADKYLRTGRRARGSDGSELKKNPGKRQRISTNINILLHPDAITAIESINKTKEDIMKLMIVTMNQAKAQAVTMKII